MTAPTTLPTTMFKGLDIDGSSYDAIEHRDATFLQRTGSKAETLSRLASTMAAVQPITAQAVYTGIQLAAGDVVTSITFTSNTTAGATLSHQFASLYNSTYGKLAVSADLTSAAWAASTEQVFTLTAPYTITADGLYYVGLCVVATTVPTVDGVTGVPTLNARTPAVAFTDTTTLSNPASSPATATVSAGFSGLYAFVS